MSEDLARELYAAVKRRGELQRAVDAAAADVTMAEERLMEIRLARDKVHQEVRRLEDTIEEATTVPA